ncbi:hypothetical protein CHUAL_003507 [Chamberlinius hualienensis]
MEASTINNSCEKFASAISENKLLPEVEVESPENLETKVEQLAKLLNSNVISNGIELNEGVSVGENATNPSTSSSGLCPEQHLNSENVEHHNHDHESNKNNQKQVDAGKSCQSSESKKRTKENAKVKNKEDRSIDHVLKALQSLKTPEERLAALCKKYTDLLEEHRALNVTYKVKERCNAQLIKEKEQLQTDYSKAVLARSRLEGLCRELQRQCKVVKEESLLRVKEEEEKRKEVSAKFQTTLTEISTLMQDNNQKNSVLRDENLKLSQKLKTLADQYEIREQHFEKVLEHKALEIQLSEAKLAKANMTNAEDKEKHLKEKQKLLEDLTEYQKRCTDFASNEVQLRAQLAMYTEKYSEFQDTLSKSNQVFTSFKGEMEKMSKKIKKLESETGTWKARWENSNKAFLEMAKEKQIHEADVGKMQKKISQLEKLCRALQVERNTLHQQLTAPSDISCSSNQSCNEEAEKVQSEEESKSNEEMDNALNTESCG